MPKSPKSKFWRNVSPTWAKMVAKIWRKTSPIFRPSISRKFGRKKFHEQSSANSTSREINKILSQQDSGSLWAQESHLLRKLEPPLGSSHTDPWSEFGPLRVALRQWLFLDGNDMSGTLPEAFLSLRGLPLRRLNLSHSFDITQPKGPRRTKILHIVIRG